jgi:hypothetical protein
MNLWISRPIFWVFWLCSLSGMACNFTTGGSSKSGSGSGSSEVVDPKVMDETKDVAEHFLTVWKSGRLDAVKALGTEQYQKDAGSDGWLIGGRAKSSSYISSQKIFSDGTEARFTGTVTVAPDPEGFGARPGVTLKFSMMLIKSSGRWKVDSFAVNE